MEGYTASSYGDRFADVYDDWYGDISDATETASFVNERSKGVIVELGSGTARLIAPLVEMGRAVVGLDASFEMISRGRSAVPDAVSVVGDMTHPPIATASAGCVFVAFNTLFNVASAQEQAQVFANAARVLEAGGCLIVDAFVPGDSRGTDERVEVTRMDAGRVTLRVSRTDFEAQTVSGQYVDLVHGEAVQLRPWHLRFAPPAELDTMAAEAGLECVERFGGWDRRPFDDSSDVHVSVYRHR